MTKSSKKDGFSLGLRGSANLWKDGALNVLYTYVPSTVKHKETLGTVSRDEKQKNDGHFINARVSHGFNFANAYALDLSFGHKSLFSKQGTYYDNPAELKGQSQEVYAGFGLGWNKVLSAGQANVRASYDFGMQYKNTNKSTGKNFAGMFYIPGATVSKAKTHYFGLSTGMLLSKAWRFDLGYNGAYAKKDQNHTVVAKIEYRM